jgi:cytochrome c oxidase cbb3-type subunit 1
VAGIQQGLMWRAVNPDGTLTYSFVEALHANWPYYVMRMTGGLIYLTGMLLMAFNTWKTIQQSGEKSSATQPQYA